MSHPLKYSLIGIVIVLVSLWATAALTDFGDRDRGWHRTTGLVEEVIRSTRRFHDVTEATAEGYATFLGCVSGAQEGAMGVHYVNGGLVGDGMLDASRPEALIYEPSRRGRLKLVGVEFVTIAEAWDAAHETPPVLEGQSFHYTGSPNRYGLPPFYALHVWAWKDNPHGTFVNWNPRVSCEDYAPESS